MPFASAISIASGERTADAKSLLAVLSLGARRGTSLRLRAEGEDAPAAAAALAAALGDLTE
jgi:phosphotransferase system HPr (HPr) family protein